MRSELRDGIIVLLSILAGVGLFFYCLMLIDAANGNTPKKKSSIEIDFKLNTSDS